jgi:putative copper resistance protein D
MDVEAPSYVLARWLAFIALIVVVGAAAFALLVLPRVGVQNDADQVADFDSRATRRAAKLGLVAGVLFLIASVWRLCAEHAVIGGNVGMGTLLRSFWGRVWIAQFVVAVIVCIAFALARASRRGSGVWLTTAIAALVLAATPAFSGHAIAAPGNRVVSVALDAIHVVAAGGWLGGLVVLALVGVPTALSVGGDSSNGSLSLVARLVNAFSPLALFFAGFVIASGLIAAWMRVGSFGALFHSTYGTVLLIKLGLVVLVLAGGAFNWLRMRSALAHRTTGQSAVGSFRRSAWLELTAGALVIAATAILVAIQPPVR